MLQPARRFLFETRTGESITVQGATITPQSQVIGIRWPGGGWVWNEPIGVQVEHDGQTEHYPIINLTRFIQIVLHVFTVWHAKWVANDPRVHASQKSPASAGLLF